MTTLRLNDNSITEIDGDLLSHQPALSTLAMNGNKLAALPEKLFAGLMALASLVLYNNQLSNLDDAVFTDLPSLSLLAVNSNKLTVVQGTPFAGLIALARLVLSNNQISIIDEGVFSGLSSLVLLTLNGNNLESLPGNIFSELSSLTYLDLSNNHLVELNPTIFTSLVNLQQLVLFKNQLTTIDTPTFAPFASTLQELYLAENRISEVGAVLEVMQQHHGGMILTMAGNPSRCHVTSQTNAHLNGAVVCTCASGFGHIDANDSTTASTTNNGSRGGGGDGGYLCQSPARAVVIPQTVATLRSHFVLAGPEEQLAAPSSMLQPVEMAGAGGEQQFVWNGHHISASMVAVQIHWLNPSNATFSWTCDPRGACATGSAGDIVNPPASTPISSMGYDYPASMIINYTVNTTNTADTSLTSANRSTKIKMAYSAFHLPGRFDTAFKSDAATGITSAVVAGSRLSSPRTLRVQQTANATPTAGYTYEVLPTTANAPVEANSLIATAIVFQLANNTCNARHAARVLDVRRTYSIATSDAVGGGDDADADAGDIDAGGLCSARSANFAFVGWEVVVGDPIEMEKATNLNDGAAMQPCTAVLQAYDTVTTEILNITTIEASVQDCWDNGNPLHLNNTRHLSCNGHGTCNADREPYDGYFEGCTCDSGREGPRCEVAKLCDRINFKVYNPKTKNCSIFDLVTLDRLPLPPAPGYIAPDFPVTAPASPTYTVTMNESFLDLSGLQRKLETMNFVVTLKPPDYTVPVLLGCIACAVVFGLAIHNLRRRHLAKKDATAALARAWKAYGLVALESAAHGGGASGMSINSGDLVSVTTTTTTTPKAAMFGDEEVNSNSDGMHMLLLDHTTAASGVEYTDSLAIYEDDTDTDTEDDDGAGYVFAVDKAGGTSSNCDLALTLLPANSAATTQLQNHVKKKRRRRKQLAKFVAPAISLGKSTLAAKGLDVLLGVDPTTYMHVKNKVKVMLKEFAKNGTEEDIRNINTLLQVHCWE
eukprot:gene13769-15784_t